MTHQDVEFVLRNDEGEGAHEDARFFTQRQLRRRLHRQHAGVHVVAVGRYQVVELQENMECDI